MMTKEFSIEDKIKAVKLNIEKRKAEQKEKQQPSESTQKKYRTDEATNHYKYADDVWIEELDNKGEGNENYQKVDKDKYFEMCAQGLIVDFEEVGLYQP